MFTKAGEDTPQDQSRDTGNDLPPLSLLGEVERSQEIDRRLDQIRKNLATPKLVEEKRTGEILLGL